MGRFFFPTLSTKERTACYLPTAVYPPQCGWTGGRTSRAGWTAQGLFRTPISQWNALDLGAEHAGEELEGRSNGGADCLADAGGMAIPSSGCEYVAFPQTTAMRIEIVMLKKFRRNQRTGASPAAPNARRPFCSGIQKSRKFHSCDRGGGSGSPGVVTLSAEHWGGPGVGPWPNPRPDGRRRGLFGACFARSGTQHVGFDQDRSLDLKGRRRKEDSNTSNKAVDLIRGADVVGRRTTTGGRQARAEIGLFPPRRSLRLRLRHQSGRTWVDGWLREYDAEGGERELLRRCGNGTGGRG